MGETFTIKAVHDSDLKPVLKKLGYWDKLQKGELKCKTCGKTITFDNLAGMKKEKGEIVFYCHVICID